MENVEASIIGNESNVVQTLAVPTLVSGAFSGLAVDVALFPIDTVKTRLQSGLGFTQAGGFRTIYAGMPSILIGSAPSAAAFFFTYEKVKTKLTGGMQPSKELSFKHHSIHLAAASVGETVACLIRVPTEVVKQRAQSFPNFTSREVLRRILKNEGMSGIYRGFRATLLREIPFSAFEFPLWEFLKHRWMVHRSGQPVTPWQGALCGSFAGALAAALTTPLDVVKTRIMVSQKVHHDHHLTITNTFKEVWRNGGVRGLFAGCLPRTLWMALGGLIFFGAYESMGHVTTYLFYDSINSTSRKMTIRVPHQSLYDYATDLFYEWFFKWHREKKLKTFDDAIVYVRQVQEERVKFTEKINQEMEQRKKEKLAESVTNAK